MKQLSSRKSKEVLDYILSDYHFLQDYQILSTQKASNSTFVATIKNTSQKVRFIKHKYTQQLLPRFRALHNLYKNGIVLADNMFILEQCEEFYYYVIEAEIQYDDPRFQTLNHYLHHHQVDEEQSKSILGKIKILVDCLHQEGQSYAGLDPRRIIIDQEKHLYLAPFDIGLQLRTDNYSRAYYPPEILEKISREQQQLSQEVMQKWDIWSFGCICLELLIYQSPLFLTTSLPRQLKQINSFTLSTQLPPFDQTIQNILINSLNPSPQKRTISTTKISQQNTPKNLKQIQSDYKQTINKITHIKKQEMSKMKQLNIHQSSQGNCLFIINLICLSNVVFQKELHISVHLGKTFHFYVDYDEKSPSKYTVNRKITIKGSFEMFCQLLSQPITIQLQEEEKKGKILVNAQGLTMIHDNQRLWTDSIIGNYSSSSKCSFPKARFKLNCNLITPETLTFKKKQEEKNTATKEQNKSQKQEKQEKKSSIKKENLSSTKKYIKNQPLKQLQQNKGIAPKKSKSSQNIPTISQISQNISKLNEELRKKMQVNEESQGQDQIQKQLSSLLQIQ